MYVPLWWSSPLPSSKHLTIQTIHWRGDDFLIYVKGKEFCTVAAESGWNPTALMAAFHQGLSKDLKHELVHRDTPASLDSLIDLVLHIDNHVRQRHRTRGPEISRGSRGAPYPLSPVHVPDKQGESGSQPMQLGHTHLSWSERDVQMWEGRCLYCGSSGHLRPACPELQGKDNIYQGREDH
ncbi:hypothetical protein P4O66_002235 [Electrophorus voltai]|uniref:CCHC-type domain-containing protein n=1 Tax=Electrophorus voltai TaxID=2609070 RepID=A0AAD9DRC9_9TELE|nr:hypothetical protein P4O66_002235 [Electrophorus voltai]